MCWDFVKWSRTVSLAVSSTRKAAPLQAMAVLMHQDVNSYKAVAAS